MKEMVPTKPILPRRGLNGESAECGKWRFMDSKLNHTSDTVSIGYSQL